jgi:hypothetical protein
MAKVANSILTQGFRGTIAELFVFKVIRGKTYVSFKARVPDKSRETDAQRGTRSTFRNATVWAHEVLCDPDKKKYYEQRAKALKLPNAYTAAIRDYMRNVKRTLNVENRPA